jgi:hypothetical protein
MSVNLPFCSLAGRLLKGLIMRIKSVSVSKGVIAAGVLFLASISAFAVPINITVSGGADVITSSYLSDFGDAAVLAWLTADVSAYNGLHGTSLLAPVANPDGSPLSKVTTGSGPSLVSVTLSGSYGYMVLHWGGKNGGTEQAYSLNGFIGTFEFDAPPGGPPLIGGLSFYSSYGPGNTPHNLPDGANTGILLGLAGVGLYASRRLTASKSV